MTTDFSVGLDAARERALLTPRDLYRFSENFMLTAFDGRADVAVWLHLGTCPDDFSLWEEQILIGLPGQDGVVWSCAYHRPEPAQRPASAGLRLRCVEPFRRWKVNFDGMAGLSPYQEMLAGRVRDVQRQRVIINLDIECRTPVWDAHHGATSSGNRGSMEKQSWASEHYQQLFRATGTITVGGCELPFDGCGVRDHSRGQRGHAVEQFGGHDLFTAVFPSGRAFGMMKMWEPEGKVSLNVGYVIVDGKLHHSEVLVTPELTCPTFSGDDVSFSMTSPLGTHEIKGEMVKTLYATFEEPYYSYGMGCGADLTSGHRPFIFAPGFAKWTWDNEVVYCYAERSNRLRVRA
jgi:hypothetical protein